MQEADIPIDIHTLKLQDWLVSRRIVPKNIQSNLKDIRSKITAALQDMPSHEKLIELLKGTSKYKHECFPIYGIGIIWNSLQTSTISIARKSLRF